MKLSGPPGEDLYSGWPISQQSLPWLADQAAISTLVGQSVSNLYPGWPISQRSLPWLADQSEISTVVGQRAGWWGSAVSATV